MATPSTFKYKVTPAEWDIMGNVTLLTLDLSNKNLNQLPDEIFELKELEALDLTNNENIDLSNELMRLTKLKLLRLTKCNLATVPAVVMKLPQLEMLILSNNRNITLPEEMSSLVNLKVLHLDGCSLDTLPPVVLKMLNLHELNLNTHFRISLPEELHELNNLKVLRLSDCNMVTVPPVVLKLSQLEELDLRSNPLQTLPAEVWRLTSVKHLNLSRCNLHTLPPEIWRLTQLEWLDLSSNWSLQTLPDEVGHLYNIKHLDLSRCELHTLPPKLWKLAQLERLDLCSNPLQTLPTGVDQLKSVKHLDLSGCRLRRLPPKLWRLTQLERMFLRGNPLGTLPAEIGQLTNVKHLDLSDCHLHTLPPEVGRLTQLEWLDLLFNPLQALPAEVAQLSNLKHFDLSRCHLNTLPPEVCRFTRLEWLDLSSNPLQTLPAEVGHLTSIKHMDLSNCQLRTLPPEVWRLTQLEWLDLRSNPLQMLPVEVGQLTNVKYLDLEDCQLHKIPLEVWELTLLECLDLSSNPLQTLPTEVGQLTNVKQLHLEDCHLRTLPDEVWSLSQLEWLGLCSNPLQSLPADVGQLTYVKHLDLSNCQLRTLPPEVWRLEHLEWLDLSSNPLQALSTYIGQLFNVQHLDLSHCQLRTLPPEVWRLPQLEWLNLSSNPLQTLPAEVGHLTSIKHLDLSNCQLRTLPPEVGRLTQLEWLDVCSTALEELPVEIGQLTNVKYLNLSFCHLTSLPAEIAQLSILFHLDVNGNPVIKPPPEVCSQGIKAIRQYFDELERSDQHVSARLKVVVLGEKMAGKTSLVRTLRNGVSSLTEKQDRTHCVEISQWAPDANIMFEVYDFGGHDVYHLTHQLFLTQDALNLLTVDLETYNCTQQSYTEAVGFWLDTLNVRVPGAVVTIVGSKSDRLSREEREKKTRDIYKRFTQQQHSWQHSIKKQLKNLENDVSDMGAKGGVDDGKVRQQLERTRQLLTRPLRLTGVCCVSSAEPTSGLDMLRRHILETVNDPKLFSSLRRILPRTWVDFEQQLRDLCDEGTEEYQSTESSSHEDPPALPVQISNSKWLTRNECLQQGRLAGLTADRLEPVLSYLQQVGTILRYTDIPELNDLVFHDPSGLIDVIKELFHHDLRKVFTTKDPRFKGFSNTKLKKIRKDLSSRGLLPREVAIVLLGPHATTVGNVDVITNLMEHFGLCYTECTEELGRDTPTTGYYIPWYIREERPKSVKRGVRKRQKKGITLSCVITGFCPCGLFERLSVVVNKLIKSRQDWKDVIVAVRGSLPIVVHRESKDGIVSILVKLTIPWQIVEGTLVIQDAIGPLKDKLLVLLKEWPGLLYHLVYHSFTQQDKQQGDQQTPGVSVIIPTFTVGPEGCTVKHGGVTLQFPQGCVNETRFISVEVETLPLNNDVRTNFTAMSAVLTVEQDFPQRFLRPVTVRLPWVWRQPGEKHETTDSTTVVLHYSREDGWKDFATETEEGTTEVTFETDQFQSYVVTRVKSVCHEIVQLWEAMWNGYCEDKVYLIVMPNKVFLPDRLVNLLCVHKLDDTSDFFSIGYVSPNHQIKQRVSMTNREMIRAYLRTDYDLQMDPRDLRPDGMLFEFPPADRNRYSFAVEKRAGVPEKDIYEGRISFERLDLKGNVKGAAAGEIDRLPILLHRKSQDATADTFVPEDAVSQHEDTGLRQSSPSQQQQQARPEPTASMPPGQQRNTPKLPLVVTIAMVAVAIVIYQFLTLLGGRQGEPQNDTSKPRTESWLPLQMDLWLSITVVAGLFVAIFGIWFSVFRKGSVIPIVLLINDEYGTSKGGISTINCQLGQILANAKAVVYSTALIVPNHDQDAADRHGVKLIGPAKLDESVPTLDWLTKYHSVHYPNLPQDVTCIIGHADITDTAARNIWEQRYPQADLVTINHVIPEDTEFFKGGQKAMKARMKEKDILHNSNNAKAVFSVGRRIFEHFKTKYRGKQKPQTHHIFLPKPSDMFLSIDVNPGEEDSEKVVLSVGRVRKVEKLKGHDLVAQSMRKVVKIIRNVRWDVRGISEDDWETSLKILEDNLNSPDLNPTLLPYGTQEDIRDDMMMAHLVLMPSRSEPFGLVGLEAIAAGIPVLISDKTGLAGMIMHLIKQGKLSAEHRHVIVETSVNYFDRAGDAKRWADRIVDILNHSASEFQKAARLKRELVESRYWEESHRTFLQACGVTAGAADL